MSVLDYEFPVTSRLDLAFPTMGSPPELLKLAKDGRFYNGNSRANDLFSIWFYGGLAKTPSFKNDVDSEKAQRAMNWAVCFMGSWEPKHEEKEAICALIFDAALDLSNIDALRKKKDTLK